jgi:iron transport multicopper oxidase
MYADVALTVARHIQQKPESGFSSSGHNITAMEVQQPLIVKSSREEETRVLRIYARVDRHSQIIKVEYVSAFPGQKAETKHATCCIEFGSPEKWLRRWSHDLYLIQDRVAALQKLTDSGEVSKMTSRLAYRLFASLVDYAPQYQRMDQVLLASNLFEATATVKLDDRGDDATFVYSPYWIDALLHLSGFVMNGNDTLNYNEAVYISHGWESLRFAKPLNPKGHYQAYVRMLPRDKTMVGGNVWILCDGEVVGLAEDLRFQRVPRTVLDMLLPPVGVKRTAERQLLKAVPHKPLPKRPVPSSETQLAAVSLRPGTSLDIISAELGLEVSDISPHDRLSDLGVDSLMSLTLASNLTEQLAITISHSELMDCNTISELLAMLDQKQGGTTSPLTNSSVESSQDSGSSYEASDSSQSSAMVETFTPGSAISDTAELVRSIIADETGIPTEDLESSADLSAVGVDSLMSLAILARLQEVGVELPTNFFLENNTMNEVFRALPRASGFVTPQLQGIEKVEKGDQKLPASNHNQTDVSFRARVVLLQKRSNPTSAGNFFLFPDGSGSPFSYAALEPISPDFDVYGLVCPFIDSPDDYTGGIEATVKIYLSAIRDQQPHGPYHFGGWSVGGVLAYEASRQLIEAKQKVQSLILIDAPCPAVLPPMSSSLIDYLASKGVFGQSHGTSAPKAGEKRQSLLKHFDSTVANLALYKPRPIIPLVDTLETLIIWAREGVNGDSNVSQSSNSTESWILDNRSDFGPHGWETVLPVQHISTVPVSGNHFTMMAGQNVSASYM